MVCRLMAPPITVATDKNSREENVISRNEKLFRSSAEANLKMRFSTKNRSKTSTDKNRYRKKGKI
jgi:hypothetical protein